MWRLNLPCHAKILLRKVSYTKSGDEEVEITSGDEILPQGYYGGNMGDVMRVALSIYRKLHEGKTIRMKTYVRR